MPDDPDLVTAGYASLERADDTVADPPVDPFVDLPVDPPIDLPVDLPVDPPIDAFAATVEQLAATVELCDDDLEPCDELELAPAEPASLAWRPGHGSVAPLGYLGYLGPAESRRDDHVGALLGQLEHELRSTGTLSFATCEALRVDLRLRGFEPCLLFLRCSVFAGEANAGAIVRRLRVQTCRLMLLSIGAHTGSPRWSSFQLEQLFEAALSIPGAELSDLVQALFALLVYSRGPTTHAQLSFLRAFGLQVAARCRRGQPADDFVWIAVRLADPVFLATEAQAVLAAHVLPRRMRRATRDTILRALQSNHLVDEVLELVDGSGAGSQES